MSQAEEKVNTKIIEKISKQFGELTMSLGKT